MIRFNYIFGLTVLVSTNARAAEHDGPIPPHAEDTKEQISFSMNNRAGLVEAPFVTTAFPEVSGFGTVLTLAVAAYIPPIGRLHARLPISFVRVDFPARAQVSETALGNLEFGLEHAIEIGRSTRLGLLAALPLPLAEHGPKTALLGNRALALSSALNSGRDALLLTPGVTGLRLALSVEHSFRSFEFRASLDVSLLVRVFDANLPEETTTHPIGILPALDLGATWWATSWFGASLGGDLITEPLRVQEPARERDRNRRLQAAVKPGLYARLGRHVMFGLDASIPVGGNLGGETWSIGTRARFGF